MAGWGCLVELGACTRLSVAPSDSKHPDRARHLSKQRVRWAGLAGEDFLGLDSWVGYLTSEICRSTACWRLRAGSCLTMHRPSSSPLLLHSISQCRNSVPTACHYEELGEPELRSLCGWLRSRVPENGQKQAGPASKACVWS